jgi:uncharacterized C2H2 Zn-finger protein
MKRRVMKFWMLVAMAVAFAFSSAAVIGQENTNTATGQMKETGKETKRAGKSMGRNMRRGRVFRGGKHFGKHIGKAGKHFGRGTKKVVKKVIS